MKSEEPCDFGGMFTGGGTSDFDCVEGDLLTTFLFLFDPLKVPNFASHESFSGSYSSSKQNEYVNRKYQKSEMMES